MTESVELDLNTHDPYGMTETSMADIQAHKEKGEGSESESQGLSPTYSGSPHPPNKPKGNTLVICSNCGVDFKIINYRHRRIKNYYCCSKCYRERGNNYMEVHCKLCKKTFEIDGSRYDSSNSKEFFCSRKCLKANNVNCDWCGKHYHKRPSHISEKNYCSDACMRKHMVGEKHGAWKGGHYKYYGYDWIANRNKARERDNYTCQNCGETESYRQLDIHHIIPFKRFGLENHKEANKLSNLITLCHACHMEEEAK